MVEQLIEGLILALKIALLQLLMPQVCVGLVDIKAFDEKEIPKLAAKIPHCQLIGQVQLQCYKLFSPPYFDKKVQQLRHQNLYQFHFLQYFSGMK
ncbi:hypothetical protein X975_15986, partial [Stegodyphus mimosarum]